MINIDKRPDIPLPIKREVRQRCGFGCVICGLPLYDYDHILGWSETKRHLADEITLLCDKHHREKSSGLLPNEFVIQSDKNPYNLQVGISEPYILHYAGSECETTIGNLVITTKDRGYETQIISLSIDDITIVGFTMLEGHLLLTLNLFDEFNNYVLRISDNQLVYSISPWDIEFVGRNLIIREAHKNIFIDISFQVPNKIIINRGHFILNGVEVSISPDFVHIINGLKTSKKRLEGFQGGIIIGRNENQTIGAIHIPNIPRGYYKEFLQTPKFEGFSLVSG